MYKGFAKGIIVGSLVGASVSLLMNTDVGRGRNRKRMMRSSRNIMRKSSNIIGDVVDLFR